jgi:hypothetical protein
MFCEEIVQTSENLREEYNKVQISSSLLPDIATVYLPP